MDFVNSLLKIAIIAIVCVVVFGGPVFTFAYAQKTGKMTSKVFSYDENTGVSNFILLIFLAIIIVLGIILVFLVREMFTNPPPNDKKLKSKHKYMSFQ